jgi:hypothetical protein
LQKKKGKKPIFNEEKTDKKPILIGKKRRGKKGGVKKE